MDSWNLRSFLNKRMVWGDTSGQCLSEEVGTGLPVLKEGWNATVAKRSNLGQ